MASTLEDRRQAIAAALRAVMAEPLPERFRPEPPPQPAPLPPPAVTVDLAPEPATSEPIVVRSLREALIAGIDWDEADEPAEEVDISDPADITDVRGVAVVIDLPAELADDEDDATAPSVPPLELGGSMSSRASMALFGHA